MSLISWKYISLGAYFIIVAPTRPQNIAACLRVKSGIIKRIISRVACSSKSNVIRTPLVLTVSNRMLTTNALAGLGTPTVGQVNIQAGVT
ncbi:hypothetical protein BV22DRAFT_8543 [Leucogyrophana mollusca]|uniref:Uncharacterized protein n=1 Tax=Leucogyrophana mollusca TaxID=85980 RepID=A0ACB8C088_9AGAM|nr:hypothetical protein BV22DRAFT_8543 [Leucogyrophana mollusca]